MARLVFCWWLVLVAHAVWAHSVGTLDVSGDATLRGETTISNLYTNLSFPSTVGTASLYDVHVSSTGSDTDADGSELYPYATIEKALAVAAAIPSSALAPVHIHVMPGVFTINNDVAPVTIPDYVVLAAEGRFSSVLKFTNDTGHGLRMGSHDIATNFVLRGPSNASVFMADGNAEKYGIYDMVLASGKCLLDADNGPDRGRYVSRIILTNQSCGLLIARNGAQMRVHDIESQATGTIVTATGAGSYVYISSLRVYDPTQQATVLLAQDGGHVDFTEISIESAHSALVCGGIDSLIHGAILEVHGEVIRHMVQEDKNAQFILEAVTLRHDRMFFAPGGITNLTISFHDTKPGDEGAKSTHELAVGMPEQGFESVFGEGDSYTRGMLAYTYNPSGTVWTDVTDSLIDSGDGDTVTMFPNTTVNSAFYLTTTLNNADASDKLKWFGVKLSIATAWVPGTGVMAWEYWNGATWTRLRIMAAQGNAPYLPLAENALLATGSYQIRFDDKLRLTMTKNDPMSLGTDYYWIRVRVTTTLDGTLPVLDQTKIHTSRSELNADGFLEFFGDARPIGRLAISVTGWRGFTGGGVATPSNGEMWLGTDLVVALTENSFDATNEQTGLTFVAPLDIDTSSVLRIRLYVVCGGTWSTGTETHQLTVSGYITTDGDTIYDTSTAGTPETIGSDAYTFTCTADSTQYSHLFELYVSQLVSERASATSGDVIWLFIRETGGSPGNTDLILINLAVFYTRRHAGGHNINWNV